MKLHQCLDTDDTINFLWVSNLIRHQIGEIALQRASSQPSQFRHCVGQVLQKKIRASMIKKKRWVVFMLIIFLTKLSIKSFFPPPSFSLQHAGWYFAFVYVFQSKQRSGMFVQFVLDSHCNIKSLYCPIPFHDMLTYKQGNGFSSEWSKWEKEGEKKNPGNRPPVK